MFYWHGKIEGLTIDDCCSTAEIPIHRGLLKIIYHAENAEDPAAEAAAVGPSQGSYITDKMPEI